jgi:hypothetical protein
MNERFQAIVYGVVLAPQYQRSLLTAIQKGAVLLRDEHPEAVGS